MSTKKKGGQRTRPVQKTNVPLADGLLGLLEEREMSLRALARQMGVSQSHLSRILTPGSGRVVSGELAGRAARALSLPEDYFPEFRAMVVHQAIDDDPTLRESLYRRLPDR